MDSFQKKFLEEATDLINTLEATLLMIEDAPNQKSLVEEVFRVMHSLKGGGAMFGFHQVSEFTHHLESVYDLVRSDKLSITHELLNITLASVDHLRSLFNPALEGSVVVKAENERLIALIQEVLELNQQEIELPPLADDDAIELPAVGATVTYYVHFIPNLDVFDNGTNPLYLVDEICHMGQHKVYPSIEGCPQLSSLDVFKCYTSWQIILATSQGINEIKDVFIFVEEECHIEITPIHEGNLFERDDFEQELSKYLRPTSIGSTVVSGYVPDGQAALLVPPVSEKKKQQLQPSNKQSEVDPAPSVMEKAPVAKVKDKLIASIRVPAEKIDRLMNLVSELVTTQARLTLYAGNSKQNELVSIAENVEYISRQLRDNAFSISLIPIETVLTRFHRLVRDLSANMGKEITFHTDGANTELDKTLIQNLTDPLLHLLRNSVDHGIEQPDVRIANGKSPMGNIWFRAYYSGTNVHIQIEDDGAGIDIESIRAKAISMGLVSEDAVIPEKEYFELLFMPGFSTSKNVTDVSGRGVGLDVVKRKIDEVRGEVAVESTLGKGSLFTIKIPLTLSIVDGLLVRLHDTNFIIPLTVVDKIYAAEHKKLVGTFNHLVVLDGVQYPFLNLREEFDMPPAEKVTEEVILVKHQDRMVGLVVDFVVGEYQAVLKPLGKHFSQEDFISGASILGDGTIALVLDTNKVVDRFINLDNTEEPS